MSRIISIVKKDLVQISRNRFIAIISILMIIVLAIIYNIMSSSVDETFKIGLWLGTGSDGSAELPGDFAPEDVAGRLEGQQGVEGLEITWADSPEDLRRMVEDEEVSAGLSLDLATGEPAAVLYVSSKTTEEIEEAGMAVGREVVYALAGYGLPVDFETTLVGRDMAGVQVPLRDKLRILLLSFVLLMELFGLANLLMEEVQRKTAEAVLVTPATLGDFVSAKAVTGVIMAFCEGMLMALLLGTLSRGTLLPVVLFLLLGAAVVVGVAFIMGAVSWDFVSMAMLSMVPLIILVLPGMTLLYPGFDSPWLKAIPTYYMVEPLNGILNYGMGLSDYPASVLALSLFAAGFLLLGFLVLKRRLA